MTIPIKPGPFSFLASLGQAVGAAAESRQADKDKKRKIAQDKLNQMITLRGAGLLGPEQFGTPEAMALYSELGIMPVSDKPTPGEQISKIQGRFLEPEASTTARIPSFGGQVPTQPTVNIPTAGPATVTDAERAVAGLPSRSSLATEKSAQQNAPLTAQAEAQAKQDVLFDSLASRALDAVIGQAGGNIMTAAGQNGANMPRLIEDAWTLAQADAKIRGYVANEAFTKPYIQAQAAQKWRAAQLLQIQAVAAQTGADPTVAYTRMLQQQQTAITAQINSLNKPSDQQKLWSGVYQGMLDKAKGAERDQVEKNPTLALYRQAYDEVNTYTTSISQLQAEANGVRDMLQFVLSGRVPGAGGPIPTRVAPLLDEATTAEYIKALQTGTGTRDQLDEAFKSGAINATDYATIMQGFLSGTGAIAPKTPQQPPKGSRK